MEDYPSYGSAANPEDTRIRVCAEALGQEGINSYLDQLGRTYEDHDFVKDIWKKSTRYMEPTDSALGQESGYPNGVAFYRGCLLGIRVAVDILGEECLYQFKYVKFNSEGLEQYEEGSKAEADEVAKRIHGFAERGYDLHPEYHGMVEELEDLIGGPEYAHSVRRGFGYLMRCLSVVQADEVKKRREMDLLRMRDEVNILEQAPVSQVTRELAEELDELTVELPDASSALDKELEALLKEAGSGGDSGN